MSIIDELIKLRETYELRIAEEKNEEKKAMYYEFIVDINRRLARHAKIGKPK